MMATYRAFEVTGARAFKLVTRDLAPPGPGQVRVRVQACGVCHTDEVTVDAGRANPLVPGHELVGVIDAVGPGVTAWQVGDQVGAGAPGGHCGQCTSCRRGDFVNCSDQPATGITTDGGYAEYAIVRASGLVRIPEGLTAVEAAPLLCAGVTTYTALRQMTARPGALVAVQGIGGLGHLAVQQANRLGYRVAAVARGTDKADLATKLGAHHYIDSSAEDPGAALQKLGGAVGIVATAASGASMSPLLSGLVPRGHLVVVGLSTQDDPIKVTTRDLVMSSRTISGALTGSPIDNEDNLAFSLAAGIRPMIEVLPWTEAPKAYDHMMSGDARFRVVLDMAA
jgi:propanol-preferring alcohol dehydrogenase